MIEFYYQMKTLADIVLLDCNQVEESLLVLDEILLSMKCMDSHL